MPRLEPVIVGPSIGPEFVPGEKKRDHYPHELAETCSLTDRVVQDTSLHMTLGYVEYKFTNPLVVTAIPAAGPVIEEYREMIREHIERRILFFFQQLIVCYQTKLHFESNGAKDQAASADPILIQLNGHQSQFVSRQAAHSSTVPCLIAYDNTQWQQYRSGAAGMPQGFVFLKGTDYYRTANATMNMPKWMNDADREIDEKTKNSHLRERGLAILNRAAQGEITPDAGIKEFLLEAIDEIQLARARLSAARKDPEVQQVLSFYEEFFVEFQAEIEEDPNFLEQFLNIAIDPSSDNRAQQVILQIRYAAIRNVQVSQAALIQKVNTARSEILAAMGRLDRKPNYFDPALRTVLIEQARTDQDRKRLEKLFNFSPFDFATKLDTPRKRTEFTNIKTTLSNEGLPYVARIRYLAQEILLDMRHLRTQEEYQRAQIIKDFRGLKGWQQWRLGLEVKQMFPHAAASQSTICRIETRKKLVTPQIAEEFSQVFKVDAGLFMPHFFYD